VLLTAARYGRGEAHLTVAKLVNVTNLSKRTVAAALADLIKLGLVERAERYGKLRVPWLNGELTRSGTDNHAIPITSPSQAGSANTVAPPDTIQASAGGASVCAPPRCTHACTSPTSIYSFLTDENSSGPLTLQQRHVIVDVLTESSDLLGSDVGQLTLAAVHSTRLDLPASTTYADALTTVIASNNRTQARDFTYAVLALRGDPRVQGFDLEPSAEGPG
jgi:hypothetical protein